MPNHFFVLPGLAPGVGATQRTASNAQPQDVDESFESVSARLDGGHERGDKAGPQSESLTAASGLDSNTPGFFGSSTFEYVATASGANRWRVIDAAAAEKPVEYAIGVATNGVPGSEIDAGGGIETKLELASTTSADLKDHSSSAGICELSNCPTETPDDLDSGDAIDVLPSAVLLNSPSTVDISKSAAGLSEGGVESESVSAFAGQTDTSSAFGQPQQRTGESDLTFPRRGSGGSKINAGAETSPADGLDSQSFLVGQGIANSEDALVPGGQAAGELMTQGGSDGGSKTQSNGDNVAAVGLGRQVNEMSIGNGSHPTAVDSGSGIPTDVSQIQSEPASETDHFESSQAMLMEAAASSKGSGGKESTSVELQAAQALATAAVKEGVKDFDERGAGTSISQPTSNRTEESALDPNAVEISADVDVAELSPASNSGGFVPASNEGKNSISFPSGDSTPSGAENDASINGAIDARVSAGQAESIQDEIVETLSLEALIMEEPSAEAVRQAGEAIGDAIRSSIRSEGRSVQMDLHPAELGALKIQVTEVDDTIETRIVATEYATSELLNSHREQLIDILTELGYETSNVDISHDEQSSSGWERRQHPAEFTYQSKSKTRPVQSQQSVSTGGINIIA